MKQDYQPAKDSQTIYYLNHTSWWDGLIPLLLNQKCFGQQARAMMEDKQMRKHGFFKRIGAFSVSLENPKSIIRSLRYAVESMKRPNASLFIYPEGEIRPFSVDKPDFKSGLSWIVSKYPEPDVVPVALYITTAETSKPRVFIKVGSPVDVCENDELPEKTNRFEKELQKLLVSLVEDAHHQPEDFQKLI